MELARVDFGAITKAELLELVRQGKTPVPQNMPASTNGSAYECPDCQDTGYIWGHNVARKCKCWERREYRRLMEASGIGEAFRGVGFEGYEPWNSEAAKARETAMGYVRDFPAIERTRHNSLALIGTVGAGKTMLGICVLNALMAQGVGVLYVPYREMVNTLKQNAMDEAAYYLRLGRYANARVLFVDDLFKGRTEADTKYVYDVVNERYLKNRPMIVTSELSSGQMCGIDEAVGSRIVEMCREHAFHFQLGIKGNYRMRTKP